MKALRIKLMLAVFLSISVLALLTASIARSQPAVDRAVDQPAVPQSLEMATVEVDGRELFELRGIEGYPATRRAAEVRKKIVKLAEDASFSVQSLTLAREELYIQITGGEGHIVTIFDADAAIEGLPRDILATVYLTRITETIDSYRRERTSKYRIKGAINAAIATVLILALLFGLLKLVRWLGRVMERRLKRRMESLEKVSRKILRADRFFMVMNSLLKAVSVILALLLSYFYLQYILGIFAMTRGVGKRMLALITNPLVTIGAAVLSYIPKLIFLIVLFIVIRYLVKALRRFFDSVGRGKIDLAGFDPEWAQPTFRIVRLAVIALGAVLAYPYIPGSDSAAFKGVSIFLGVIFSLGSTSVISNIMAGYSMIYRRAFKVGDRVKIQDAVGDVTALRLLVTHLRSLKNEEIIIPNSTVLTSEIINYTALAKSDGLILHTTVGIGYETPWRQVEAMLIEAASRVAGILKDPKPFVLQTRLGDFCVTYELNAYCNDAARMLPLYTELHENILDVFNEYGVQIMTPAYIADPALAKVVPKDRWFEAPAGPEGKQADSPGPQKK